MGRCRSSCEATRDGGPNLIFDGAVTMNPGAEGGVALAYAGAATATGAIEISDSGPPTPWRASATLSGDLDVASAQNLVLRFGPDERALETRGAARLFGGKSPRLWLDLDAKQLDFDALLRGKDEDAAPPARAFASFWRGWSRRCSAAAARPWRSTPPSPLRRRSSARRPSPTSILRATASAGAPLSGTLALNLPGDASVRLSGGLEFGAAPGFKGALKARLGDIAQLRDWATRGEPEWASRLAALSQALPYRAASASGEFEISAVGILRPRPRSDARSFDALRRDRLHRAGRRRARAPVHGFEQRRARRRRAARSQRQRRAGRRRRSVAGAGGGEVAGRSAWRRRVRRRLAGAQID